MQTDLRPQSGEESVWCFLGIGSLEALPRQVLGLPSRLGHVWPTREQGQTSFRSIFGVGIARVGTPYALMVSAGREGGGDNCGCDGDR